VGTAGTVSADARTTLGARLRGQAAYCEAARSPFYAELLEHLAVDAEAGGPTWDLLGRTVDDPALQVPQLRLLGAVHRLVLGGAAPELTAHYPSVGGDADAAAAWPAVRSLFTARHEELARSLDRPPQTNEVGRSAALIGGFLTVSAETGHPLRIPEVGASAGLNLRFDHFWYQSGEHGLGDAASPVRFVDVWEGPPPPFDVTMTVSSRAGCDHDPIDPASDTGRVALLGYVWPDQPARFALLRSALDVAARVPATIDQADALEWVAAQLADPHPGEATVVFHSIVMQYFGSDDIAEFAAILADAGARATPSAPLAWLRLEPTSTTEVTRAELRLTLWPEGEERLLALAGFHGTPVEWRA
jgi:hypothetical protein